MNTNTHLYLYAKHWYQRSNVVEDIRKIVAHRAGLPRVTIADARLVLLEAAWHEIIISGNPEYFFMNFIEHAMRDGIVLEALFNACLYILEVADGIGKDIGNPDPTILPLDPL